MSRSEDLKASMPRAGLVCLMARPSREREEDSLHKFILLAAFCWPSGRNISKKRRPNYFQETKI